MDGTLDLAALHAFVVVAEEEHVGRAAARLNISASPLSRRIKRLEEELGLPLFKRARRRIRLSDEGRRFLGEARSLLAHAAAVRERTRAGVDGTLAVGCSQNAALDGTATRAVAAFRRTAPGVSVRFAAARSGPQIERLRRGELDIAFVNTPPVDDLLVRLEVGDDPFVLALPADHPLAREETINPGALDGEPWFALDAAINPGFDAEFLHACLSLGFRPDMRYRGEDLLTGIALVDAGLGMCLMQSSIARLRLPETVALRPLPGFPLSVRTTALWRREETSPTLRRFIPVLRATIAETRGSGKQG